jgi:hypothetical protein
MTSEGVVPSACARSVSWARESRTDSTLARPEPLFRRLSGFGLVARRCCVAAVGSAMGVGDPRSSERRYLRLLRLGDRASEPQFEVAL